jgi:uncharacterized protein (TIGR02594 family)
MIWLEKAKQYIGLTEVKGAGHNPKILEFWKTIKLGGIKDDETSWCAAFVGAVLENCGIRSTRKENARSYEHWGVKLDEPVEGAIVVFWRYNPKGIYGHVGFVAGRDQAGNLMVLGGNQGDKVSVRPFSTERVLCYRWPAVTAFEARFGKPGLENLPLISSDGKLSTNEA